MNLVCSTGLSLANTGWVQSTFSIHCTLSSKQRKWLFSAITTIFLWKFFGPLGSKPGAAGSGSKYANHCAMLSTFHSDSYLQVTKMLGNGRLEAMCFDGQKRLCHIRGKLRKKVWINQSDIILVSNDPYSGLFLVGLGLVLRLERLRSIEKVRPLA